MKASRQARKSEPKEQAHLRAKHVKQLEKVEQARARLEKAQRKLQSLELALAALTRERYQASPAPQRLAEERGQLRPALLILNPQSKAIASGTIRIEQIIDCLRANGIQAELKLKTSGKVARQHARSAVDQGAELLIVAAGDGTIEDVVPELINARTALGIIPIGTMNNLAKSLGVPLALEDACALLAMSALRHVDVARVSTAQKPRGAFFLETAGVGLSALAAPLGQDAEKGRWGQLLKGLGHLFSSGAAGVTVTCDDGTILRADTQLVTVSNAPLFGANMLIAPDAKMDDGLLEIALYDGMSHLDLERHFLAIADGRQVAESRVTFHRARRARISADRPLEANADLEVLSGQQVWDVDVLPGALTVVAGPGMALTLPMQAVPARPEPQLA
jgi:YegS/Rv2252/BmrU family lipid kinase